MEHTFKSAQIFVMQLSSQFEYFDFSPPINPATLKEKLEQLLSENNAFWDTLPSSQKWGDWYFIQFKSFKPWTPVCLGLFFQQRKIMLTVFDEFNGSGFSNTYMEHEIDLTEVWLNHKLLFDGFWKVIGAGLQYVNRASKEEKFQENPSNN